MNKIGSFGTTASIYQNSTSRAEQRKQNQKTKETEKKEAAKKSESAKKPVQLSRRAQSYLEQLKKKFADMDFVVANYENEEEAAKYLSGGTKEYSVLIDPETLEKMASDEEGRNKLEGILSNGRTQLSGMLEELGEDASSVKRVGIEINDQGVATYFAELDKMSQKQSERLEKSRKEKAEEKGNGNGKETIKVRANSIEELLKRIRAANENMKKQQEQEEKRPGREFDYSI